MPENKTLNNLLAIVFGVSVALLLLVILELGARLMPKKKETEYSYPRDYWWTDHYGIPSAAAGTYHTSEKDKATGRMIYDVDYTNDEYGRRVTPVENPQQRDKFFALVGCSLGYGEGVNQDQTLAAVIGQLTRQTMPYNYSFLGRGPYDFLAVIESLAPSQMKEKNGTMVYLYVDGHLDRLVGSMSTLRWKKGGVYYRKIPDGRFVRDGTFETGRANMTRLYKLLGKSALLKKLNVDFPPKHTAAHFELAAQVIAAMRDSFLAKYPKGKFYVLIYPQTMKADKIKSALNHVGVAYFDYSELFDLSNPKYHLDEQDPHPSVLAYHILAEEIVKDLRLK